MAQCKTLGTLVHPSLYIEFNCPHHRFLNDNLPCQHMQSTCRSFSPKGAQSLHGIPRFNLSGMSPVRTFEHTPHPLGGKYEFHAFWN